MQLTATFDYWQSKSRFPLNGLDFAKACRKLAITNSTAALPAASEFL